MNKIAKQFILVGVLIGVSGTGLYTYYLSYSDEPLTELSRFRTAKEHQAERSEQLQHDIEQGLTIPSSSEGSVHYNEQTGTNIIMTSNDEIFFD